MTKEINESPLLDLGRWYERRVLGKSGTHKPRLQTRFPASAGEIHVKSLPRKTSKHNHIKPVPQTDTGSPVEKTKANE